MFHYDPDKSALVGPQGSLPLPPGDQASVKMAMLLQGQCTAAGPSQAARNFNFSKSRYYQILKAFAQDGVAALIGRKTGPKRNYRRTPEVTKLVIRCRFLDPEASPALIASKLRQDGYPIATRSVERIIGDYGLQKKTPSAVSRPCDPAD